MSELLYDTNVISELTAEHPNPRVVATLSRRTDVWLCSVVLHELEYGVQLLPHGARRNRIHATHQRFVSRYQHQVLPLDRAAANSAAQVRAHARNSGRPISVSDALIAGTAIANDLTLVTRNVKDFEGLGVDIINPWDEPSA